MACLYRVQPSDDPDDGSGAQGGSAASFPARREDLAFSLELWDASETTLREVLAVTSSTAIAYATYYAAVGQYADATVILRHKRRTLARWSSTTH